MKKLTNRAKQALKTKKYIYECGIELIRHYGYDNVTVEDIAKQAKVSIGTFYHYFVSKSDLLEENFNRGDVYFHKHAGSIFENEKEDFQKIIDYFILYARLSIEEGLERVKTLYIPTNQMFITHGRLMQDLLTAFLEQAQERGTIDKSRTAEEITERLFVAARGVIFDWCLHEGKTDLEEKMQDIISRLAVSYRKGPFLAGLPESG